MRPTSTSASIHIPDNLSFNQCRFVISLDLSDNFDCHGFVLFASLVVPVVSTSFKVNSGENSPERPDANFF
eukprot:scaffold190_cov171-Amphora_coffeaeformis.AAC.6